MVTSGLNSFITVSNILTFMCGQGSYEDQILSAHHSKFSTDQGKVLCAVWACWSDEPHKSFYSVNC